MAAIPGRYATLEISTDGNTFEPVGGIVDVTFNKEVAEVDITSLSSGGKGEYLHGREDCTIDLSCRLLEDNAGQAELIDAADDKEYFYWRFKTQSSTSRPRIGRGLVTSFAENGPLDDVASVDATIRCTALDIPDPALDLRFAETLSLTDQATGSNLVTFTRATSASYVGADGLIKYAAAGQPRFDHDPVTGESFGLLIEEQRTNLVTYSEGGWDFVAATIQSDISVSPSGELTADRVTTTSFGGVYKIVSSSSGQTVTCSAFVKYVSGVSNLNKFGFETLAGINVDAIVYFDFITGTVTSSTGPVESYSVTRYANGWFRVSVTATSTGNGSAVFVSYAPSGAVFDIWGAQIEVGAFPTSYIPTTTGAAVTRNTDEVYVTGTNFSSWYNSDEGTLFAQYQRPVAYGPIDYDGGWVVAISGSSLPGERIEILTNTYGSTDREEASVQTNGVYAPAVFPPSVPAQTETKMAISAKGHQASASRDGSVALDFSTGGMPIVNQITIGMFPLSIQLPIYKHNGTIKRLTYYNIRLNNAIIQGITL